MKKTKEKSLPNGRQGFTLVELLVVIAIIGLLSTLAVVALGSARSKARDARRISDIKQIQTALELYFADQGSYPAYEAEIELGSSDFNILTDEGFESSASATGTVTYMGQVPGNFPTPASIEDYTYSATDSDGSSYTLNFELEGAVGTIDGTGQATPSGLTDRE